MHVLSYASEVRLRSMGGPSNALVGFIAKAHGLDAGTGVMVAERRLRVEEAFPPREEGVLSTGGWFADGKWVSLDIDWRQRKFSLGAEDVRSLLDALTQPN